MQDVSDGMEGYKRRHFWQSTIVRYTIGTNQTTLAFSSASRYHFKMSNHAIYFWRNVGT